MKKLILLFLVAATSTQISRAQTHPTDRAPALLLGNFTDDYGISYSVNDTLWLQLPRTRFHIIRWNLAQQYLIAKNDTGNPGDGGQYTRIDFMRFDRMEPWKWGYCLTAYNAKTDTAAEATAAADRANPKKGCNGFPFSRMKLLP